MPLIFISVHGEVEFTSRPLPRRCRSLKSRSVDGKGTVPGNIFRESGSSGGYALKYEEVLALAYQTPISLAEASRQLGSMPDVLQPQMRGAFHTGPQQRCTNTGQARTEYSVLLQ